MSKALANSVRQSRSLIYKKIFLIIPLLLSASAYANCPDPADPLNAPVVRYDDLHHKYYVDGADGMGNLWRSAEFDALDISAIELNLFSVSQENKNAFFCRYSGVPGMNDGKPLPKSELRLHADDEDKIAVINTHTGNWSVVQGRDVCFFSEEETEVKNSNPQLLSASCPFILVEPEYRTRRSPF